jgi:hypothetical protein
MKLILSMRLCIPGLGGQGMLQIGIRARIQHLGGSMPQLGHVGGCYKSVSEPMVSKMNLDGP